MKSNEAPESGIELIPPFSSSALVLPPGAGLRHVAVRLVSQARADGVALTGGRGLLTGLVQQVLQEALEAEITDHLGCEPHAVEGRGSGNLRGSRGFSQLL